MKKIRLMALLLSVTSCLMLFSVGFASWSGLASSSVSTSGSFVAYPAVPIEVKNVSMTPYSDLGFITPLNANGTGMLISDMGEFAFDVTFSEACFSKSSFEIQFKINLTYDARNGTATDLLPYCTANTVKVYSHQEEITSLISIKKVEYTNNSLVVTIKENGTDNGDGTWQYDLRDSAVGGVDYTATIKFRLLVDPSKTGTKKTTAEIFNNIKYAITPMMSQ